MDPVTAMMLAGLAAKVVGGIMGQDDAQSRANAIAAARNAVLKQNITKQNALSSANRDFFNTAVSDVNNDPATLAAAQKNRSDANVGNMTPLDTSSVPTGDAPSAVQGEYAKRTKALFDLSTKEAQNSGKLGGYSDDWFQHNLAGLDANRNIGVNNNFAEGNKAILPGLQDAAGAAASRPPSIWGPLLSAAGGLAMGAGAAGGAGSSIWGSSPAYGGGNMFTDEWGGSSSSPLPGLTAADYGDGF